jgi:hypothetical protein
MNSNVGWVSLALKKTGLGAVSFVVWEIRELGRRALRMLYLLLLRLKLRALYALTRCLSFEALYRLRSIDSSALAFVYCDHTMQVNQTPDHLSGSLLAQLTNMLPYDDPVITELLKRRREGRLLDRASHLDYIRRIAMSNPSATIRLGVDGFDELPKDHQIHFLRDLGKLFDIQTIRFLFFGRHNMQNDIKSFFQQTTSIAYLQIIEDSTLADRRLFLQERLNEHNNREEIDENHRILIMEKLGARDSTYVLVHSHLGVQLTKIP